MSSRLALFTIVAVAACSGGESTDIGTNTAIRVINASQSVLNVTVDGQTAVSALQVAQYSSSVPLTAGSHQLQFRTSSGVTTTLSVDLKAGAPVTAFAYAPTTTSLAAAVMDTGSVVPAGKSKLRVSHLASTAGAIEIWRTQPDYQIPIHIMTPFNYLATSPYLQSDAGNWEVFITPAGSSTKLLTTGAINIPSGERRTVVLLDSAGILHFRVLPE
jgi:hypothetical protein